jgi:peroxiredoxin
MQASKKFSMDIVFENVSVGDTVQLSSYTPKITVLDTAVVQEGGLVSFRHAARLPTGMYRIGVKKKTFEFFLSEGESQSFSVHFNLNEGLTTAKFDGSRENAAFAAYAKFMQDHIAARQKLQVRLQQNSQQPDSVKVINEQIEQVVREVKDNWTKLAKKYKNKVLGMFIAAVRDFEPEPPVITDSTANRDSLYREYYYTFYKNHFFDPYSFSSPYLLRTPFYARAINTYFTKILKPSEQEAREQIAWLLQQVEQNKPVYQYTVRELYDLYKSVPYHPELEQLYVEIGQNYIVGKPEMWEDSVWVAKIAHAVQIAALNPKGGQAIDLKLNDLSGNAISLYDVQSDYTVLYFFNPQCGTCAVVTPELHKIYQKYKNKGMQVFAVYVDRDKDMWMKYIVDNQYLDWINVWDGDETAGIYDKYDLHAIPMIYLLDKNKVIIERDVAQGKLDKMLDKVLSELVKNR